MNRPVGGTLVSPIVVLIGGSIISLTMRWGPDWPAQEFRGWLAAHYGLIVWNNNWYAGMALPGYSAVYPLLALFLGVGAIGVSAAVVAAYGAVTLSTTVGIRPGLGYVLAVALVLTQLLLIGQIPFLLGVAFGVWAFWCVQSPRTQRLACGAVLAALSALSSPLAGAFIILLLPAVGLSVGVRRALPLSAALVGIAVPLVIGGESGRFATQWESVAAISIFVAIIWWTLPRSDRALRFFALCYLIVALVVFIVPNPVGSNITRLGKLVALPLVCYGVASKRVRNGIVAGVLVGLATTWMSIPFVTAIARGVSDQSKSTSFYVGLLKFLHTQDPARGRLEIPFTREHWESARVARAFPLARGWERQIDLHYNGVLYRPLSSASYRHWLDHNAVTLVALPNAPLDYGGSAEAHVLRTPPPYLTPVWHDTHWAVWRVRNAVPLVSGDARMDSVGPASFVLTFSAAGSAVVRFRRSDLWQVTDGTASVELRPDGWLTVRSSSAGRVTVRARLNSQLLS